MQEVQEMQSVQEQFLASKLRSSEKVNHFEDFTSFHTSFRGKSQGSRGKEVKAEEMDEEKEETKEARGSDVHKVGFWGLLCRHIFDMSMRGRQATACQADGITKATCSFRRLAA